MAGAPVRSGGRSRGRTGARALTPALALERVVGAEAVGPLVLALVERARGRRNAQVEYETRLEPTVVQGQPARIARGHCGYRKPVLVTSPLSGPRVPPSSQRLTWLAFARETR